MNEFWFLNNDIPTDVLSRLPTKTLLGLKCVSKEWHRLISDRSFVHLQLKKTEPISGFFFQERYQWCNEDIESISYIPVENLGEEGAQVHKDMVLDFLPQSVVVAASCHGLVCCRTCSPSLDPQIYVCNPSNKDFVTLKLPSPDVGKSLALAFDPFKDPIDVSTNFKVVRVCQAENETEDLDSLFLFDIYSSLTGSWKRSSEICVCKHNLYKNKGIYIKGIMYWMTDRDQVVMFDLENELSWLIDGPFPSTGFNSIPEICIGESDGHLHYVLLCEQGLQLWVLEDHFASRWELKCSIELDKWEEENPQFLYKIQERVEKRVAIHMVAWVDPLAYKDGLLLMRVSSDVYLYNFETRKMKRLCALSLLGPNSLFAPIVLPYATSLVPVGHA